MLDWFDGRCVQGAGTYSPGDANTRLLGIPTSRGRVTALDLHWDRVSRISFSFRSRITLSLSLLRACCPEDSEHTDLPLPAPSSPFRGQFLQCAQSFKEPISNCRCRSRSLPDLTGHLTARADDGHALPLGSLGKTFNLTFILPSLLVSFSALN